MHWNLTVALALGDGDIIVCLQEVDESGTDAFMSFIAEYLHSKT